MKEREGKTLIQTSTALLPGKEANIRFNLPAARRTAAAEAATDLLGFIPFYKLPIVFSLALQQLYDLQPFTF
jgi:hypothetical protein